jgi:hypothetical protein
MNMRPRTAALLTILLTTGLLFGIATSASAESPGLDQYVETVPSPDGNDPTEDGKDKGGGGDDDDGSGGGGGSTSGPTVDSSQLDALRSQGRAGERAAEALEATSNVRDDGNGSGPIGAGPAGHEDLPLDSSEADGKAPVEAILSSMFGGGGILLPIIMLAVLVGGLVIAARTRAGSLGD